MNDNQLLTVDQAAERLQVSVKTVRNLIKSGQLAHYRIGAGRGVIRISVDALEQHLAGCEVRAGDGPPTSRRQEHRNLRHIKL